MSLNASAICDASSRPVTGIRWVRTVSEIRRAVRASDRNGRRTRPARTAPSSVATAAVASWMTIWVRIAESISPRSNAGKLATTNSPSSPRPCSGIAT